MKNGFKNEKWKMKKWKNEWLTDFKNWKTDSGKSMIDFEKLIFENFNDWLLTCSMIDFFLFSFLIFEIPIDIIIKDSKMKNEKWKTSKNEKWKMGSKIKNEKLKNEITNSWVWTPRVPCLNMWRNHTEANQKDADDDEDANDDDDEGPCGTQLA